MAQPNLITNSSQKMSKAHMIGWVLTVVIPFIIFLIPTGEFFSSSMKLFLMISTAMLCIIIFENMHLIVPAILMPILYVLTGLAPAAMVYNPWASFVPWMTLGGFIFAATFNRIGLLKRISYWCILKTGGTFTGILYGLTTAGIIINILVPGVVAIPMAAFAVGLCLALGLGKSREAGAICMVAAMSVLTSGVFVYNQIVIVMGLGQTVAPDIYITLWDNLLHNIPFIFIMYFTVFIVDKIYKKGNTLTNIKERVMEDQAKLGPMSSDEKKSVGVCLAVLVFLMTEVVHGIPIGWGIAIGALLLFFPGINVGNDKDIKEVNFSILFLVTAFMAMGGVAGYNGWGIQLGEIFMPHLAEATDTGLVMMLMGLIFTLNLVLTPLAIQYSLVAPMTQVAMEIGLNPIVVWYMFVHAVDLIVIPYQYVLYLVFFSFGLIYMSDFVKIALLKLALHAVFIPLVVVPWWRLMGLL